jgi:hypothetical protein
MAQHVAVQCYKSIAQTDALLEQLDLNLAYSLEWHANAHYFRHRLCWLCALQNNWPFTVAGVCIIGREPRQVLMNPASRALGLLDSLFLSCAPCAKHWVVAAIMPSVTHRIHNDTLIIANPFFDAANEASIPMELACE